MKRLYYISTILLLLFLCSCQTQPWEDTSRCLHSDAKAQIITVDGKEFCVDEVIKGELCDAHLSGIVYIEPDIQLKE